MIPAEQIVGPGELVPGIDRVLEILSEPRAAWRFLSEESPFFDTPQRPIDALKAGFPAGTLSGAPKVRAMEIIDEVEPVRRGIYAGCAGYFAANGSMDTCILLRTGLVKDNTMYVQAGVGVVADSDLEAEYHESVLKARALVRAAEEAVRFASAGNWNSGNTRR